MRLTPLTPIRVCSPTRQLDELVYCCDQHTAQDKEEKRQSLPLYFLIVTFLTNKWLLITHGHLRMEKTRLLCQWKSLLYSLLLCKSVFYYSELFLQWSLSCVSKRFRCSPSQWIIHCVEILRLCTVPAGSPAWFQGADLFSRIQIKNQVTLLSCLPSALTFINMKTSIHY